MGRADVCSEERNSPQGLGEEALAERNPYRKKTDRPHKRVIVVVVVVVVVVGCCCC